MAIVLNTPIQVRFRVDLAPGCSVGPGKVALLEAIDLTGSLSAAARALGMSYRRAWLLLMSLNHSFGKPVATASVGGRGGGGVEVTELGHHLIRAFRAFDADVCRLATRKWRVLARAARPGAASPPKPVKSAPAAGRGHRRLRS